MEKYKKRILLRTFLIAIYLCMILVLTILVYKSNTVYNIVSLCISLIAGFKVTDWVIAFEKWIMEKLNLED